MTPELHRLLVPPDCSIREVIECIERNAKAIALVVDQEQRLLGTVTDGDIRRAILSGMDLDLSAQVLLDRRTTPPHPTPLTAPVGTSHAKLLRMMSESGLRHIPLVDEVDRLADVALLSDLVKEYEPPLTAVVMAGGLGTRLRPLTEDLPKPMLPVGGRPLLELIVEQLRDVGIRSLNITTHFKGKVIEDHFGDGTDFGVDIRYFGEKEPLGTAGALGLLKLSDDPLLVINGDILTRVDFRAMRDFHREYQADMTVAVRQQELDSLYGVVETDGVHIIGISEKPVMRYFINAGIYLLNPAVCREIPTDQPYDMPDLIGRLVEQGRRVVSFPVHEYWLDIGEHTDYQTAQKGVVGGNANS